MRDIKFRGKPVNPTGYVVKEDGSKYIEFEYGGFYRDFCYGGCPEGKDYIICFNSTGLGYNEHILVHKESVGQYTGLNDKNGKEIYEGDIVTPYTRLIGKNDKKLDYSYPVIYEPMWSAFVLEDKSLKQLHYLDEYAGLEVIGNIYENPDLLKHESEELK